MAKNRINMYDARKISYEKKLTSYERIGEVDGVDVYIDLSNLTFKILEMVVDQFVAEKSVDKDTVTFVFDDESSYYDSYEKYLTLTGTRLETQAEIELRVSNTKAARADARAAYKRKKAQKEDEERALFEKLKEKYGSVS